MTNHFLVNIIDSAQEEIDIIQNQIDQSQHLINDLKQQQNKLRKVIKAASDEPLIKPKKKEQPKKVDSVRAETYNTVMSTIIKLTDNGVSDFTIPKLQEMIGENLTPSTVNRAVNFLRHSGVVRMVGKEGQAPIYRIGQMGMERPEGFEVE